MAEVATEKASSGGEGIVAVNPRPNRGVISKLIGLLEKVVVKLGYDSSQPHHYLSGNFAPVPDETPPTTNLPVSGHLPKCLNGEFVRVGPNPKFSPVAGYHWFDGDGMTHGLRIKDEKHRMSLVISANAAEMFTFDCLHTPPYVTYRVISKDGFMHDPVPITVSGPIMMHDFAITENYAIFMDLPLLFKPNV
ncbi:hypothetical protein TIFTF001_022762 [Ficus carica]|uniref:carotenoid 9,10-dioxygenase n=1 Tax=Ficus carica TaxID=3494 RepID=A0AA88AMF6_FICCA|nr:hypothetical protein TIFTF001_022762 [Ficus carica]